MGASCKAKRPESKVGKVEQAVIPKVAGAIEAASKKPVLGRAINLGMEALGILGKKVVEPLTQGVSGLLLTPQAMAAGKGGISESYRYAKKKAKKISMGQAGAGLINQIASPVIGDVTSASWLKEDFNIFDQKQRDKAFRDEWSGILVSGATDLALAALGTKGVGLAMRGATKKVVGPKRLVTTDDMDKFRSELDTIVAEQTLPPAQRTKTGLSVLVDDAVKETNLTRLAANPLVAETKNPKCWKNSSSLSQLPMSFTMSL